MSTWNHRVFRQAQGPSQWLTIRETFYDDAGKVEGWTVDAIAPGGETLDELRTELERMLACLDKPILEDTDDHEEQKA